MMYFIEVGQIVSDISKRLPDKNWGVARGRISIKANLE